MVDTSLSIHKCVDINDHCRYLTRPRKNPSIDLTVLIDLVLMLITDAISGSTPCFAATALFLCAYFYFSCGLPGVR